MSQVLNEKQKRFAEEWMIDMNGTQAAIRAGYSQRTANEQAARMLAKVSVQAYIQELRQKLSNSLQISQERVLKEYARLAFSDIRTLFNVDGALKPITELDDDAAAVLSSVEVYEEMVTDVDAEEKITAGVTKKVKLWDKRGALDSICKVMGYNAPEKVEHTGDSFLDYLKQTSSPTKSENKPRKKARPKPKAKKPKSRSGRKK